VASTGVANDVTPSICYLHPTLPFYKVSHYGDFDVPALVCLNAVVYRGYVGQEYKGQCAARPIAEGENSNQASY